MKNYNYGLYGLIESLFASFLQFCAFWGIILINKFIMVFIGALFGWVIGCFFSATFLGLLSQIGITGFSMWQIGAFLGFVGSFFGGSINFNKNNINTKKEEARH